MTKTVHNPDGAFERHLANVEQRLSALERSASNIQVSVEAPHIVGASGEPAFEHGWTNYAGAKPAGFYKLFFPKAGYDLVCLQGQVNPGTPGAGNQAFTLPAAYRPVTGETCAFPATTLQYGTVDGVALIFVDYTGAVVIYCTLPQQFVTLGGVSFLVPRT